MNDAVEDQNKMENTSTQGVNSADEGTGKNWAINVDENDNQSEEYYLLSN